MCKTKITVVLYADFAMIARTIPPAKPPLRNAIAARESLTKHRKKMMQYGAIGRTPD